jgi:anhydro-N-acetylmuramic acid kinase
MLSAASILKSIKENYKSCDEIFICGGGAFNETLIINIKKSAKKYFSKEVLIDTTESLGFNPKSVEAGLFAWLAMMRINNIELDYTNITGAKKPCILGNIYRPM